MILSNIRKLQPFQAQKSISIETEDDHEITTQAIGFISISKNTSLTPKVRRAFFRRPAESIDCARNREQLIFPG